MFSSPAGPEGRQSTTATLGTRVPGRRYEFRNSRIRGRGKLRSPPAAPSLTPSRFKELVIGTTRACENGRWQTVGMTTVLVVDDEPAVRDVVRRYLERDGHHVVTAEDGDAARTLIEREEPGLVLLDVMLPGDTDGLALCRWIRSTSDLPVILLTARVEETDRIVGLELGADDYVTKPFSPRELATRVKTVLRRAGPSERPLQRIDVGPLVIDASTREACCAGQSVDLTAREFDLLWFLASNPNRVFSRDQLMHRVWGYATALDTGTVTVHVRRLREKVERNPSAPELLETVWGVGYRLRA